MMNEFADIGRTWIVDYGMGIIDALLLLFVAWVLSAWVKGFVIRSLGRAKFDLTLTRFFASAARWIMLVLTGLAALSAFGVETTSFAAIIAAGGLGVGLARQGTLSSFAAGIGIPFPQMDVHMDKP